jgi:subtilisin family serine protease
MHQILRVRIVLPMLALGLLPGFPASAAEPLDRLLPAHGGRLIVKYRDSVHACAHCLLAGGVPFASVTGSPSLDRRNRELGIRSAHGLFFAEHGFSASRGAAWADKLAQVEGRFPARAARAGASALPPDLSNVYVVDLPPGISVARAAALYAADPDVAYAEPDYEVHATLVPNDPFFSSSGTWGQPYRDLWGLAITQAAAGWDVANGSGTTVAVIDTGVDPGHPDLAGNMWTNPGEIPGNGTDDDGNGFVDDVRGWDFVTNDNTPTDLHGHGTHVAGTIAALGNNGVGVIGMAWGARIMPVRGLDAQGSGYVSDLAEAIVYAAENGADVLSNSWGGGGRSQALIDAIDTARGLGAVVVAAAGNNNGSVDAFEPAGLPGVIAVGATAPNDVRASFSNHGDALSVAAPGVDVLSLRGAVSKPVGGSVVATNYLRLSGTSMACPHASGLAALLLSGMPGLSPDEVRWQLELNADQPGYPGYAGERWNPYFGWGRINAARVFDPVPVTTRLRASSVDLHAFADDVIADVARADFSFSSTSAVAWTLAGPTWLAPAVAAGTGAASVALDLDATGLAPGRLTDSLTLSAPDAIDGGDSFPVALTVHADPRAGAGFTVASDPQLYFDPPRVESDGVGSVVVWPQSWSLYGAYVDGAGTVSGPYPLATGYPTKIYPDLASDGRNYLMVWIDWSNNDQYDVKALRLGPDARPIDAVPITVESRHTNDVTGLYGTRVGFDGIAYTVLWGEVNVETDVTKLFIRRVGTDGSLGTRKREIYPAGVTPRPQAINPEIGCMNGQCLVVWKEADGETSPTQKYIDKIYGVRLVDDDLVDQHEVLLLRDADGIHRVANDGTNFALLADRTNICAGPVICGEDVIAARITPNGAPLDVSGVRLNTGPAARNVWVAPTGMAFDGTSYVTTFLALTSSDPRAKAELFLARFRPDGSVVPTIEEPGLLLDAGGTAGTGALASTRTASLAVWQDSHLDDPNDGFQQYRSIEGQRALSHAGAPPLPDLTIGAIGAQAVAEGSVLSFTVAAPALNQATTVFSATQLPPGAVFDAPSRTFRWKPAANEAGVYPGVHFAATDGGQALAEDVVLTVSEARLSLGGRVTLPNGDPVPGVAIKVTGTKRGPRRLMTDLQGRYFVANLASKVYRVGLDRPSSRQYRSSPRTVRVPLGSTDRKDANLVVTFK